MLRRLFIMLMLMAVAALGRAQTLQGYEYWIDGDYAAHQSVSTTQPDISLQLPTEQMGQGVHFFNFRAQATDGEWGPLSRYLFFVPEGIGEGVTVTKMQCWIDNDHSTLQTVDVSGSDIAHSIDVSQFSVGVHYLGVRLKNSEGEWSAPTRHFFFVPDVMGIPSVTKMEYWFDNDLASRQSVDVDGTSIVELLDVSQLSEGVHYLNLRLLNSEGTWSIPSRHFFFNPGADFAVNSPLVGYQYMFNDASTYVSIPEQLDYELKDLTLDLPDSLLNKSLEEGCQYTFTATEARLVRTTPMTFSIAFENKAHNWSNRVGEAFSLTDEVTHNYMPMPLRESVRLEKIADGDFHAMSIDLAKSQKYFFSSDKPCSMKLFKANGTLLTTIHSEELTQTYATTLDADVYYAIVYDMIDDVMLTLMDNQVPTPVISYADRTVTISCGKAGATIRYTLDGTTPTSQSQDYSAPFTVDCNCTVKAIATYSGMDNSEMATYQVDDFKVETPVITFANLHAYISCATDDATIRYSLDGSDPLTNGKVYTEPVAITANCTVKAVATRSNFHDSEVAVLPIDVSNVTTATPVVERQGNNLMVTCLTQGARFYYTTDGTTPTEGSQQTDGLIRPPHNCTVKVIAMSDGELPSAVVTVNVDWMQAETPSFIFADSKLTISCGTPGAVIYYSADGTTPTRQSVVYQQPIPIDGNLTIRALAVAEGFNDSEIGEFKTNGYTCALPTIRLDGSTLVMDCSTEGAVIYYTLDGTSPEGGTIYSSPVSVSDPCTVRAIAKKKDYNASPIAVFQLLRTDTPLIEREGNNVVVSSATEGAAIYYTIDGTTPTAHSLPLPDDGRIVLPHNLTIRAIAMKDQQLISAIGELAVDWFQAEKPSFVFTDGQLTIVCNTPGAVVYYEIGDEMPTRASAVYREPLTLVDNRTVRALAVAPNFNDSEVGEYEPDAFTCEPPVLAFDGRQLTMSCATEGVTIRYTLDGSQPGNGAEEYVQPVDINRLLTVSAIAMKANTNSSEVSVLDIAYYYDGTKAETAAEGLLDKAFQWSGTDGIEQLTLVGKMNDADMQWLCHNLTALQHLDMSGVILANNELTTQTFSGLQVLTLNVPQSVTKAAAGTFSNCPRLAAITWSPSFRLSKEMLGEQVNPNLLLYVKTRGYAPAEGVNVVVNNHADVINLSDAEGNSNFYCPQEFVADHISYTHHYSMQTGLGNNRCSGWETLALPFDVQQVTHPLNGVAKPFAADRQNGERPFWLCLLGTGGFESTSTIAANTPYIIAMPNHPSYADEYLLAGNISFEAANVTVQASSDLHTGMRGNMTLVPSFIARPKAEGMLVLNTDEEFEGYVPGSAFFADLEREIRPFQAYVMEQGGAMARILFIGEEATGIAEIMAPQPERSTYFDLQGRKVGNSGTALGKGIYIIDGRKMLVK